MGHMEASWIKTQYSMSDILARYGLKTDRHGFIVCPFHGEKTASCKIYSGSFYCFGCGTGGDVIDFVQKMENLQFGEVLTALSGPISFTQRRKMAAEKHRERLERDKQNKARRNYRIVWDKWIWLDKLISANRPSSPEDVPNAAFLFALQQKSDADFQIDCLPEAW